MKSFKLYIKKGRSRILVTEFDNLKHESYFNALSTFDENLSCEENDKYQLTFSLSKTIPQIGKSGEMEYALNPYFPLLSFGAKIILELDELDEIEFVITGISPKTGKNGAILEYTAQDSLSYQWSRRRLGYSYTNSFADDENAPGPETIYEIARKVIDETYMWIDGWSLATVPDDNLSKEKFTLSVQDSNPYNVLIEACTTINAYMKVDFRQKKISFIRKDTIPFSGYRFRPDVNMVDFKPDFSADDMVTVLHVKGAENEYGEVLSLVPAIPEAIEMWLTDHKTDWMERNIDEVFSETDQTGKETQYTFWEWIEKESTKECLWQIVDSLSSNLDPDYLTEEKKKEYDKQVKLMKDFTTIANKVPYLGQFIINLDFFKHCGEILDAEKGSLDNVLKQMRNCNVFLRFYNALKYKLLSNIGLQLVKVEEYAFQIKTTEEAIAEAEETIKEYEGNENQWALLEQARENKRVAEETKAQAIADFDMSMKDLIALLKEFYGFAVSVGTKSCPEYDHYVSRLSAYKELLKDWERQARIARKKYGDILKQGQVDSLVIYHWKQKVAEAEQSVKDYNRYIAAYNLILDGIDVIEGGKPYTKVKGWNDYSGEQTFEITINQRISELEKQSALIWRTFYVLFGDYIIEGEYSDDTEIDSISLFNQAISHFESLHHPIQNYSFEALDLSILEPIAIPRLSVGSKIKVFDPMINLGEKLLYDDEGNVAGIEATLNDISYTNYDMTVSSLSYPLRNAEKVSISIEQIIPYQILLEKMIMQVK